MNNAIISELKDCYSRLNELYKKEPKLMSLFSSEEREKLSEAKAFLQNAMQQAKLVKSGSEEFAMEEDIPDAITVDILVDFNPKLLVIFTDEFSTVHEIDISKHTNTPYVEHISTYPINKYIEEKKLKPKKFIVTVYEENNQSLKRASSKKFPYNNESKLIVKVQNKRSAEADKLRDLLHSTFNLCKDIIRHNKDAIIEAQAKFIHATTPYDGIPNSEDTQRKLKGAFTSAATMTMVSASTQKLISILVFKGGTVLIKGSGIIGFFAGILVDVIVNKLVDKYWLEPTEQQTYDQRKELLDAILSKITTEANQEFEKELKLLEANFEKEVENIDYQELKDFNGLKESLMQTKAEVKSRKIFEGVLYHELLSTWVYENAGDDNNDPGNGADDKLWKENLKKILNDAKAYAILCKRDVYLYQLKKIIRSMGIILMPGYIENIENIDNVIYNDIKENIEEYVGMDDGKKHYDNAYEEYYKRLDEKLTDVEYSSMKIKIENAKAFIDFFTKTATDECSRAYVKDLVSGFVDPKLQNKNQFKFTLKIKKPELILSECVIFAPRLAWKIIVEQEVECIMNGEIVLDDDN